MKTCICHGAGTCLGCKIRVLVRIHHGLGAMAWIEAIYAAAEESPLVPALKPHRDPLDALESTEASGNITEDDV
jgi:hypothetical protein